MKLGLVRITSNSNRQQIPIANEFAVDLNFQSADWECYPELIIVSKVVDDLC